MGDEIRVTITDDERQEWECAPYLVTRGLRIDHCYTQHILSAAARRRRSHPQQLGSLLRASTRYLFHPYLVTRISSLIRP